MWLTRITESHSCPSCQWGILPVKRNHVFHLKGQKWLFSSWIDIDQPIRNAKGWCIFANFCCIIKLTRLFSGFISTRHSTEDRAEHPNSQPANQQSGRVFCLLSYGSTIYRKRGERQRQKETNQDRDRKRETKKEKNGELRRDRRRKRQRWREREVEKEGESHCQGWMGKGEDGELLYSSSCSPGRSPSISPFTQTNQGRILAFFLSYHGSFKWAFQHGRGTHRAATSLPQGLDCLHLHYRQGPNVLALVTVG